MAQRGRPKKTGTKLEAKRAEKVSNREVKPFSHMESGEFGNMEGREALYAQAEEYYAKQNDVADEVTDETMIDEEPVEENAEEAPEEASEEEVVEKPEYVPEKTSTESVPEDTEIGQEEEAPAGEPLKTVPYGAMKQEREKRKELQRRLDELERKLAEGSKVAEEPENLDYMDPETLELKKRLDAMERKERQRDLEYTKSKHEEAISKVHADLLKQGIDGFSTVGRYIVSSKLNEMYIEDPDYAIANDTPEGWAKIYVDTLPHLQKIGQNHHMTEVLNKKKEAKKDASLVTKTGKSETVAVVPTKAKSINELYMEERSKYKI